MSRSDPLPSQIGTRAEREALLAQIGPLLSAQALEKLRQIFSGLNELLARLERRDLSLVKLRELLFGASTESARHVCDLPPREKQKKAKAKGHGRRSHHAYTGAQRVKVSHPTLRAGQTCPECQKGKLRPRPQPAVAIQVKAQPPVGAVIHEMEQLRCDTCGTLFTAPTPPEAGPEKYDPSVGIMVRLLRYGSGMPFHRLERLQASLGVPLPASVQWEQMDRVARELEPVLDHLIYLAAQSALVFSDDTKMRVSALRKEIQAEVNPQRTGIFTSGIVSQAEHHPIALFFTGRAHAGENLADVLERREPARSPPLHMRDGLAQNAPKGQATVDCACVVHARRNFVEIRSAFPQECRKVVESLAEIYRVEAQAQAAGLSPQERLVAHQTYSQPVMDELSTWLTEQIQTKQVEPNSTLGEAIAYMRKRWTELTQFLRIAGAPLDNNATERILKMSILHRKNSLFYRTQRGADVGDMLMSLIQTCRANAVNPFDYLLAVVRNAPAAKSAPEKWMPWNYPAKPLEQTTPTNPSLAR